MSEKEYKNKCEMMFKKNTILINENEQLKEQIEKMKCCGNCKYFLYVNYCNLHIEDVDGDNGCQEWELAE